MHSLMRVDWGAPEAPPQLFAGVVLVLINPGLRWDPFSGGVNRLASRNASESGRCCSTACGAPQKQSNRSDRFLMHTSVDELIDQRIDELIDELIHELIGRFLDQVIHWNSLESIGISGI